MKLRTARTPRFDLATETINELATEVELTEYADRMVEAERILRFGVWRWDLDADRVLWSDELHRIYGIEPGTFAGTVGAFIAFLHPDDRDRVWSHVQHTLTTLEPFVYEERIIRADGKQRLLLSQGRAILDPDGRTVALVGVCQDVSERVDAQRALGLSERRMRAIIDHSPSVVAVKDLDGRYLMANAELGHLLELPADELIGRECTELFPTIAEQLRANDRLAAAEMEPVYDEAKLEVDGKERTFLTVTFALPDEHGRPIETCTIATDVTGRRERESERRARRVAQRRITSALAEDRLEVFAQPVVDLRTGAPEWHELLVRMRSRGSRPRLLGPASFMPAAERFGLVQAIDTWMVEQALQLAASVVPEVNISAVTLCDATARDQIIGRLERFPDAAARLVFEITETAVPEHLEAAQLFAAELTRLGCGLALDDFGTGFGSFTYLRTLPLRYLKIDASFVSDLEGSRDNRRVVQSVIEIARQFDLLTIAEGVEDESTLALLRELGADYAQGFHLGAPAPVADGPAG
jgi:PAS domain S-box-containing protein